VDSNIRQEYAFLKSQSDNARDVGRIGVGTTVRLGLHTDADKLQLLQTIMPLIIKMCYRVKKKFSMCFNRLVNFMVAPNDRLHPF